MRKGSRYKGNRYKVQDSLDATFEKIREMDHQGKGIESEIQSHLAKYLCVLCSGYIEVAVKEIVCGYCNECTNETVSRYIDQTWRVSRSMNSRTIIEILGNLNKDWGNQIKAWFYEGSEQKKDKIDKLVDWRNKISHGDAQNVNQISLMNIKEYYDTSNLLLKKIEEILN